MLVQQSARKRREYRNGIRLGYISNKHNDVIYLTNSVIFSGARQTAAGSGHIMVLSNDGTVWACGENYALQCVTYENDINVMNGSKKVLWFLHCDGAIELIAV